MKVEQRDVHPYLYVRESARMEEKMKIVLAAVNAKYIHSNLAVYSLKAYAKEYEEFIEIREYTINHYREDILAGLYGACPDVDVYKRQGESAVHWRKYRIAQRKWDFYGDR